MKRCLVVQYVAFEDPGVWGPALQRRGYELVARQAGLDDLAELEDADLALILGAPISAYDTDGYPWLAAQTSHLRARLQAGRPTIGVCLGAQLMAIALGGHVGPGLGTEIGWSPLDLSGAAFDHPLAALAGVRVLHWHGDNLTLPQGATGLASTPLCPVQAFQWGPAALALQFHAEADPGRIERWLIGHAHELAASRIHLDRLREDTARYGEAAAQAGRKMLEAWLDGLPAGT